MRAFPRRSRRSRAPPVSMERLGRPRAGRRYATAAEQRRPLRVVSCRYPAPSWDGPLKSSLRGTPRSPAPRMKASTSSILLRDVRHAERPAAAAPCIGAARVRLGFDEVAHRLARIPADRAARLPAVEILGLSADLDEPVHRARAPERAAARPVNPAPVHVRFGFGLESPVEHRVVHRAGVADRDMEPRIAVRGAGLEAAAQSGRLP